MTVPNPRSAPREALAAVRARLLGTCPESSAWIEAHLLDPITRALDDAERLERHFQERIERLQERVSYYEGALCLERPNLRALPGGATTGAIAPERVAEVLTERAALRTRAERAEEAPPPFVHRQRECDAARRPVVGRCTCGGDLIEAALAKEWRAALREGGGA